MGREVTGQWLDEVQPVWFRNPTAYDRFRFMVETGRATWRRGFNLWDRDPEHRRLSCAVGKDGEDVDMIFYLAVIFDYKANEIRI